MSPLWFYLAGLGLVLLVLLVLANRGACLLRSYAAVTPHVSLLLVVHNQQQMIEGLVRSIISFNHIHCFPFELVVVDDSSVDQTCEILQRLQYQGGFTLLLSKHPFLERPIRLGLTACRGEVICYFHLHGAVHPRQVASTIWKLLNEENNYRTIVACNT